MKIKDVEKETGISAHSIRFYEEMGLIQIERKADSGYRDFSAEDVKKIERDQTLPQSGDIDGGN